MGGYSGGFSSTNNNNSSSSNGAGAGGGMVGFGNPRFNSASSKPSSSSHSSSKWLPASVANKLDSLSMLPKDRAGGLRFEVIRPHLTLAAAGSSIIKSKGPHSGERCPSTSANTKRKLLSCCSCSHGHDFTCQ